MAPSRIEHFHVYIGSNVYITFSNLLYEQINIKYTTTCHFLIAYEYYTMLDSESHRPSRRSNSSPVFLAHSCKLALSHDSITKQRNLNEQASYHQHHYYHYSITPGA